MGSSFGTAPVVFLSIFGALVLLWVAWLSAIDLVVARMSKTLVQNLADERVRGASKLLQVIENRQLTSAALLGGRVSGQTLGITCITVGLVDAFGDVGWNWWKILLLSIVSIGLYELVVVAILPYKLAGTNPKWVALRGAGTALALRKITGALNPLLDNALTDYTERGADGSQTGTSPTLVEDLRDMADEMLEEGTVELEEEDKEILRSVFELGQTRVGELMVPRTEMVTILEDKGAKEALRLFMNSGFSRIPVICQDIDNVVGVLYFKDIIKYLEANPANQGRQVKHLCRKAAFIPETKLADDELREMQKTSMHLALIVDEYGGIAGLITIEDILEELVGELHDEHDTNVSEPKEISPGQWLVPSSYSLDNLGELFDVKVSDEDVYSVGGLLSKAIGQVPLAGAQATVQGLHLVAQKPSRRRRQIKEIEIVASVAEIEDTEEDDQRDDERAH